MPWQKVNPYTLFKQYNLDFCTRVQDVGTQGFDIKITKKMLNHPNIYNQRKHGKSNRT